MGHERYHSLTPKYYKKELFEKAIPGIIIALCGNKIALDNRQVSKEDGEEYENKVGCIYIEVSAKSISGSTCSIYSKIFFSSA